MTYNECIEKQKEIDSYLKEGCYTLICPSSDEKFEGFVKLVNERANPSLYDSSIHSCLKQSDVIKSVIDSEYNNESLTVRVIYSKPGTNIFLFYYYEDFLKKQKEQE